MNLSTMAFWFIVYKAIRQRGLLSFLPPGLQKVMLEVSFFDILVNILIHRRLSKMIVALIKPFIRAETPEEAKAILKEEGKLPTKVYKGLFRKGIMNNMSTKMRAVMLPVKEPTLAKKLRSGEMVRATSTATEEQDVHLDIW